VLDTDYSQQDLEAQLSPSINLDTAQVIYAASDSFLLLPQVETFVDILQFHAPCPIGVGLTFLTLRPLDTHGDHMLSFCIGSKKREGIDFCDFHYQYPAVVLWAPAATERARHGGRRRALVEVSVVLLA
jgi:hypothetical protein